MRRLAHWHIAVRAVLVLVALLPFLPEALERASLGAPLARALDAWFGYQCERDPARMLALASVCARCLGIYLGVGIGGLVAWPRLPGLFLARWLAMATLLLALDVLSEGLGWRAPSASLRLATGFVLGYPVSLSVLRAIQRGQPIDP